ncbi:hypothetical protein [Sphingobium sp. B11D3A]|uniref:hypothetical protein n=1 Tax=Sphingobium sp. B11D3A TaxID=2940574 RepID=UPI002224DF08|nr:hypothetical protein [Sphingobium sp. B11D3A]MCW2390958.1 putative MAPEG superfamily protein [Sphingobium sp. B11D3A]
MTLQELVQQAAENAKLQHHQAVREKRIQHAADTYGHAAAYDNAVVIAGYAAFFALWAGTNGDLDPFARLLTVALMGISLLCYIIWQVSQMLTRQNFEFQRADVFRYEENARQFNEEWEAVARRHAIAQQKIIRCWPYFFLPSVVFGLAAGGLLVYNALAGAFGWPQTTGQL